MKQERAPRIYFKESRLEMTVFGRFVVRLVTYAAFGICSITFLVLIASELPFLRSVGLILGLFLIDRLLSFRSADRSIESLIWDHERVNLAWFMSPATFRVIEKSFDQAILQNEDFSLHLLENLTGIREVEKGLLRIDVNPGEFSRKVEDYLKKYPQAAKKKDTIELIQAIVTAAFDNASRSSGHYIEPKDLFVGLMTSNSEKIRKILYLFGVEPGDIEYALIFTRFNSGLLSRLRRMPMSLIGFLGRRYRVRHRIMNRAWTARPTRTLDRFSVDLTDLARLERVGFLVGHDQEYDRLTDILSRSGKPNALLVGEPGVGKETLVAHLAFNITRDKVPPPLFDTRLVMLEIGSLVAGASESELQERMKRVIDEVVTAGNVVLYIPDIHNLLKTSGPLRLSAADILMPAMKSSAFSVIGATYPNELKRYLEPESDLLASFETIRVDEVTEAEAVRFLIYESIILEQQHNMLISLGAVKTAVNLAHRYFRGKLLPSSASDLLKETLADIEERGKKILVADDVVVVAEKRTNVPIRSVGKEEASRLLKLEDLIHERLIDQHEAVVAVARALREYRSGLVKPGKPIAVFLFIGPTGVGKTELSKILTKIHFGDEKFMVRLDMSEYQTKESIYQLIGSPKGEVRGMLTDAITERPYSLILLDEFEKSHPDILNLFLQVFDDGRLTDSTGRTVSFENTIMIATSNAHSELIKSEIEKGTPMAVLSEILKKRLVEYFKPELLNRFSNIIVFKNLSREDIQKITVLSLKDLSKFLEEQKGLTLQFDDGAIAKLAELGYDPVFGARPLKNVISEKIRSPLAERILRNEVSRGDTIAVSYTDGRFQFTHSL